MKTNIERAKEVRDNMTRQHRELFHLTRDIYISKGKILRELDRAKTNLYKAMQDMDICIEKLEKKA